MGLKEIEICKRLDKVRRENERLVDIKTTKDCPCNCKYLILLPWASGCKLGRRLGAIIMDYEGGEAKIK